MKTTLLFSFAILFLVFGCKKDQKKTSLPSGTYKGTFYYNQANNMESFPASVTFKENTYSSVGQSNKKPAGGSGSYSIHSDSIHFKDQNAWTAEFDWGLILNDDYNYKIKGDSLILTKSITNLIQPASNAVSVMYQYKLKRVN